MTWRRAKADGRTCGSCRAPIAAGAVYAVTRTNLLRCRSCAERIEPQPDVITEDETPAGVPSGIQHQPSMFGGVR